MIDINSLKIGDSVNHIEHGLVTIVNRCININIGTNGKHLYNREQAIALLTTAAPKRGRRRAS